MNFNIIDETSNLRSVIIGIAKNSGNVPKMKDFYDPQSLQNFKNNNYPSELDLVDQLSNFVKVLRKNNTKYIKGIANLGYRPTFNQKKILLEVHLFNFSGNLYNKYLSVEFLKFIRREKKFKNVNQLRAQIKTDLSIAKKAK